MTHRRSPMCHPFSFRHGLLAYTLLIIGLTGCHTADTTSDQPPVATVGSTSISRDSFDRLLDLSRQPRPFEAGTDSSGRPSSEEILTELVKETVLMHELEARGLSVGSGDSPRDVLATDLRKGINPTHTDLTSWFEANRHLFVRKAQLRFLNVPFDPESEQGAKEPPSVADFFALCDVADKGAQGTRRWGDIGWLQAGHAPWWPRTQWNSAAVGNLRRHHWPVGQHRLVRSMHFRPQAHYSFNQVVDKATHSMAEENIRSEIRRILIRRARTTSIDVLDDTLEFVFDPFSIARTEPGPAVEALDSSFGNSEEMEFIDGGEYTTGSTAAEIDERVTICKQFVEPALGDGSCARWKYEDEIQRQVTIKPFFMDREEVKWEDYQVFVEAARHRPLPQHWSGTPGFPVANVSREDAQSYCRWRGKRLPTADEWEFAARGVERRRYPWGNDSPDGTRANFCDTNCPKVWQNTDHDDGFPGPSPVGSFPAGATPEGLLDMGGNIREWTATVKGDRSDVKGGGFFNAIDDMIAADVRRNLSEVRDPTIGFRCAQDAPASITAGGK